jgi:glycosyltransferase involved in cell wall biosynthesis
MEGQLEELIKGLLARGFHITVVARLCRLPAHSAMTWHRVRCPRRPFPIKYGWFFLVASWIVARHRRGLLHTTGAVVLNHADLSTVHHCHHAVRAKASILSMSKSNTLYQVSARFSLRMKLVAEVFCYRPERTRLLIADSLGAAEELRHYFPSMKKAIGVVPLGVGLKEFRVDWDWRGSARAGLSIAPEHMVAIFVGGDWERKGLRYAIEAVAAVEHVILLVVGPGDAHRYGQLAAAHRCIERVRFVGTPALTAPYYAAADVFLFPTAYETFSLATHEAAAAGLPLLVTRTNGVEEILVDGINGWFIPRDAEAIAGRLTHLRDNPDVRLRMGEKSRKAVSPRTWSRMVDEYISIYQRVTQTAVASKAIPSAEAPACK